MIREGKPSLSPSAFSIRNNPFNPRVCMGFPPFVIIVPRYIVYVNQLYPHNLQHHTSPPNNGKQRHRISCVESLRDKCRLHRPFFSAITCCPNGTQPFSLIKAHRLQDLHHTHKRHGCPSRVHPCHRLKNNTSTCWSGFKRIKQMPGTLMRTCFLHIRLAVFKTIYFYRT